VPTAINTPRGVDIVASLCKLYDASEADVRAMLERVNSMIQSHIDSKDILGTVEKEKFIEGIDTG
jgi:retinoblastoma-like protein 1